MKKVKKRNYPIEEQIADAALYLRVVDRENEADDIAAHIGKTAKDLTVEFISTLDEDDVMRLECAMAQYFT